jgi:hypothetical protein
MHVINVGTTKRKDQCHEAFPVVFFSRGSTVSSFIFESLTHRIDFDFYV